MNKIVIVAAALSALATTSYAADLPARMPVKAMPAPVVQSWTGCYLGAGGGYAMTNRENSTFDPVTTVKVTEGGRGWFGTAQFGCDYQFDPNWLVGAFVDGNYGSVSGQFSPAGSTIVGKDREKSSWAVGGRVGYLIYPQLLGFVSAGWTEARHDAIAYNFFSGAPSTFTSPRHTFDGWFIGTGYEYKLTWLPGLTWKTEYRASDFGRENTTVFAPAGLAAQISNHLYEQSIRSELVWRFNSWIR